MQPSTAIAEPSFELPPVAPTALAPREPLPRIEPRSDPPPHPLPATFTARLLATEGMTARHTALSALSGLGLSALFGLTLGARQGGSSFALHALFVPAILALSLALGVPALYIALALFDVPLDAGKALAAAARAAGVVGLVLAGLAPAVLLYVVTSDDRVGGVLAAAASLALAGTIGLGHLFVAITRPLRGASHGKRFSATLAFTGFAIFSVILTTRTAAALLPIFRGIQ